MPDLSPLTRQLLHTLLDRFEQPNRRRVARVRLTADDHPAYFSTHEANARQQVNAELVALARQGPVRVHWRKWEEGNWLEAVDLVPEEASELLALLQREPRRSREQALRDLLNIQPSRIERGERSEWRAAFLTWAAAQLNANRSVAPLDLDHPDWNRDLLLALDALSALQSPVLERTFSVTVFGDSKRFEALRGSVLRILRHHAPQALAYGEDDDALLRAFFVERVPEYVPLAGTIVLELETARLDLAAFRPSVALPATLLRQATVADCQAAFVVTIENATSFSEMSTVRPASTLLVYTGGFASPTVISFLCAIRQSRPSAMFYHWGDMDAGGLRILAHLRGHLESVKPLAMDSVVFERHHTHAQPLTRNDCDGLAKLRASPFLGDCVELIDHLLTADCKLEQEAVPVSSVIGLLSGASW